MKPNIEIAFEEFDQFFTSNNIIKDEDEAQLAIDPSGADLYFKKNKEYAFAKFFKHSVGLPGHFYAGRESCGQVKTLGCLHETGGSYIQRVQMTCKNKACNKCHDKWAILHANEISNRLYGFSILKRNGSIYNQKRRERIPSHLVISAPLKDYSKYYNKEDRKKQRQKLIKMLMKYGLDIDGGVMIDHIYRFTAGLKKAYWSPHHHILYTGWIDGEVVKKIYETTGYIVKQISQTETWTDLKNQAKYLLSHSAVYPKQEEKRSAEHGYRYFGEVHNKKLKVESMPKFSVDSISKIKKQFEDIESQQMLNGKGIKRIKYNYAISEKIKATQFLDLHNIEINGDLEKLYAIRDQIITYIQPRVNEDETYRDNPANTESVIPSEKFDELVKPPRLFEGLILRVDFMDEDLTVKQSVYRFIILDETDDVLCPRCSKIMKHICLTEHTNHEKWKDFLAELPDSIITRIDNTDQEWAYPDWSYQGLPYFNENLEQHYDPGTYKPPETMELPFELESIINRNIAIQEIRAEIKQVEKRSPPIDEILSMIYARPKEIAITTLDGGRTNLISKTYKPPESNRTIPKSDHVEKLEKF